MPSTRREGCPCPDLVGFLASLGAKETLLLIYWLLGLLAMQKEKLLSTDEAARLRCAFIERGVKGLTGRSREPGGQCRR